MGIGVNVDLEQTHIDSAAQKLQLAWPAAVPAYSGVPALRGVQRPRGLIVCGGLCVTGIFAAAGLITGTIDWAVNNKYLDVTASDFVDVVKDIGDECLSNDPCQT